MKKHLGIIAWGGLASYVVAYDLAAIATHSPTLSSAFHQASTGRFGRWLLLAFWLYLTSHLFRWVPARYDAFRMLDRPLPTKGKGR